MRNTVFQKYLDSLKKVAIIGGAGAVGSMYGRFFLNNGYNVAIIDPSEKAMSVAGAFRFKYMTEEYIDKTVSNADVVVFSVPIDVTEELIAKYAPLMKCGAVAMDVTSVKEFAMDAFRKYTRDDVYLVGTHPLFRPDPATMFKYQNVVLIPERINGCETFYENLKGMFEEAGAKTVEWGATEHDRIMAVVQCLAQENTLAVAGAIKASGFSPDELRSSSSLLYAKLWDIVNRVIGGKPELYASILTTNRYSKEFAMHLKEQASILYKLIEENDTEGIEKYIMDLKSFSKKVGGSAESLKTPRITGREIEIFYHEKDEARIKSLLGDELHVIDSYLGYREEKEPSNGQEGFKLGEIKAAWLKNSKLLDLLDKDEHMVRADEQFFGTREYRFQGRTTFLIEDDDFVKAVLSDEEFIGWYVALDKWFDVDHNELMRKMAQEEIFTYGLNYKAIHFNTKRRTSDRRKDWLNVLMEGTTDSMPVVNFFETIAFQNWEKFGYKFVVVRGENRMHRLEQQEKEKNLKEIFCI